ERGTTMSALVGVIRVLQSDLEPMITPTSALIVVPLSGAPAGALKNQQATQLGVACHVGANQRAGWLEGATLYRKAVAVAPVACRVGRVRHRADPAALRDAGRPHAAGCRMSGKRHPSPSPPSRAPLSGPGLSRPTEVGTSLPLRLSK